MKEFFEAAVQNIVNFGDTDIFPFPIENHIIYDQRDEFAKLLRKSYSQFKECFVLHPPNHINTLSPVGLNGFRWATQQDPFWNAFLLGVTLSLAEKIETSRIPVENDTIFSYRINMHGKPGKIFREDVGWREFVTKSIENARNSPYVVLCDIADCYQRIPHHRLDNALQQIKGGSHSHRYIMEILKNFSDTKSYGIQSEVRLPGFWLNRY